MMDPFMDNFLGYEGFGPPAQARAVPEASLVRYRGKLPDQLLAYWREFGWCSYARGLFWTVDPALWDAALEAWIVDTKFMERDAYHVIARTAFGELILWGERSGQSLKVVPAWGTIYPSFDDAEFAENGPDRSVQLFFASQSRSAYDMTDMQGQPLFERALQRLGPLDHETLYGFVPALALGGDPSLERLQRLDAKVHLDLLSQLTPRREMLDIAAEARRSEGG
jgi:hypothetical protein